MDDETRVLDGSHLLVATGRVPNTDTLNVRRRASRWTSAGSSK